MTFKIVRVDHDGYNGRETFPLDSDIGTLVTPLKLDTFWVDAEGDEHAFEFTKYDREIVNEPKELGPVGAIAYQISDGEGCLVHCWLCANSEGRLMQLMDHEIELYRA